MPSGCGDHPLRDGASTRRRLPARPDRVRGRRVGATLARRSAVAPRRTRLHPRHRHRREPRADRRVAVVAHLGFAVGCARGRRRGDRRRRPDRRGVADGRRVGIDRRARHLGAGEALVGADAADRRRGGPRPGNRRDRVARCRLARPHRRDRRGRRWPRARRQRHRRQPCGRDATRRRHTMRPGLQPGGVLERGAHAGCRHLRRRRDGGADHRRERHVGRRRARPTRRPRLRRSRRADRSDRRCGNERDSRCRTRGATVAGERHRLRSLALVAALLARHQRPFARSDRHDGRCIGR